MAAAPDHAESGIGPDAYGHAMREDVALLVGSFAAVRRGLDCLSARVGHLMVRVDEGLGLLNEPVGGLATGDHSGVLTLYQSAEHVP
jgi:hypothetical protein